MRNKKVVSQRAMQKIAENLRRKKMRLAAVSGCFDILHRGHIDFLSKAKKHGDILVVLLNSDKSVKSYKGPTRPLNSLSDRADVLSGLASVDYIVPFDETAPLGALSAIKPQVFCQGSDWGKNCIERDTVEKHGGTIAVIKKIEGISTTSLLKKIQTLPPL